MMASIRNELNMLDVKISEFQQLAEASGNEPEPIDLEHIELTVETPEPEVVVEPEVVEDDDLPFFEEESVFAEPEPVKAEPAKEEPAKEEPAVLIDTMLDKFAWKNDMPGSSVKDVRSAISLNDRILFINKLFAEDPMAFQSAIGKLNAMESLDDVVAYVKAEHADWNLESDVVYRFMMAVRRKVR